MRYGTIVQWDQRKKFGFIRPDRGPDIFFHISALGACSEPRIELGQPVKYEVDPKTLPKRRPKKSLDDPAPEKEPERPKAMMVELIDKIPGAILEDEGPEARVAHHPKARRKKPTWRR